MLVAGTSTHKVGEVAQTLLGVAPSASTISRLNQSLTQQFEVWRQRSLQEHWRVLYLDGVHFSIRHGDQADATIILTALAVDLEGNKEVLARRPCAEESKDGWLSVLQDLRCSAQAFCKVEGPSLYFELTEIGTISLISLPICSLYLVTQNSLWHPILPKPRYMAHSPKASDRPST